MKGRKFCEDCRYSKTEILDGDPLDFEGCMVSLRCMHSKCSQEGESRVFKEVVHPWCTHVRDDESLCGEDARFFRWSAWRLLNHLFMKITRQE